MSGDSQTPETPSPEAKADDAAQVEAEANTEASSEAAAPAETAETTEGAATAEDGTEQTDEKTEEEEAREAIEAIAKLGPLFERAVRSVRPVRFLVETQRLDRATYFRNFKGQRTDKFTRPKMVEILHREIFRRENALMAHLLMVLWNEANKDLYIAMRKHVQTLNEDVEKVEKIDDDKAKEFVADLKEKGHGVEDIFICVRLNEVRFSTEFVEEHITPQSVKDAEAKKVAAPAS